MSSRDRESRRDLLAEALEALRHTPQSTGPPAQVKASTVGALRALEEPADLVRLRERRKTMFRIAGYSSAAAAALLLATAAATFWFFGPGGSYAFADVIENVKKAKAVIFNIKSKIGNGPELELTWYLQGDRVRMDLQNFQIKIADLKKRKGLDLFPSKKLARRLTLSKGVAKAFDNPIAQLRRLKPKDAKKIGREKHGGNFVDVYQVDKVDLFGMKGNDGEMKIWVDPKTQLPVRIKMSCNTRMGAKGKPYDTFLTIENISWHETLDPDLFSLTPPKGYKVTDEKKKP